MQTEHFKTAREYARPTDCGNVWRRIVLLLVFVIASGVVVFAAEETTTVSVTDNWEQHIPPTQGHGKTDLFGTDATDIPGSGGKVLIKGARIVQYPLNGDQPEMIADSPSCIYDLKHQEIDSSSPLHVHVQDGKLFLEGTGFLLLQKDLTLIISNDVHTVLKNQGGTNNASDPGTEIFSQHGRFEMKPGATNGLAIYQRDVRVIDPKMKLWSEILTVELPRSSGEQTNRPRHIVAETNVAIDFINEHGETTHATGDKAIYDFLVVGGITNETLELTGNPKVQLTNGWMKANSFAMNRATGRLVANGDCHFHYEAPGAAGVGGAPMSSVPAPPTDIFAENFEFDTDTRVANFWGHVRVENARMTLTAATLAADLPKQGANSPGRIEHILAETNVVIDFTDEKTGQRVHATGEKAVYDYRVKGAVTNEALALSGNPEVQTFGPHAGWMTADVITADRAQGKVWGTGNHHSVFKKQPGETAMLDTEIFSDDFEFSLAPGVAIYRGKVRAYDPAMNLTGQQLNVTFAKSGSNEVNAIQRADAKGDVVIDLLKQPFSRKDFTNLPPLAVRLQKQSDPVAAYVAGQLSPATCALLANYTNGPDEQLPAALASDFNVIVQSSELYNAARFTNVFLSVETSDLLRHGPLGVELTRLNRLLLLDAFRGEIARNKDGEKTHATGDEAIYIAQGGSMTNAFLELYGHPRLTTPDRTITADISITDDPAAGIFHAVGNPRYSMKVGDLVQQRRTRGTNNFPTK